MTANAWVAKYFAPDSRPSDITVARWLRKKVIPSKKVGGMWFVDEHEWLADGDELVRRVLEAS